MVMHKLTKLFFLFQGLVSILAICPDSPTLPAGGIILNTDHFVITPTSAGMSNFPTSTTKLSILGTITANEACASGSVFNLFSVTVTPTSGTEKEVLNLYVDCSTSIFNGKGDWGTQTFSQIFDSSAETDTVSFAFTMDLAVNLFKIEIYTPKYARSVSANSLATQSWSFDSTTQINVCSAKQGASPISCTVSDFKIVYDYFASTASFINGYAQGSSPTLAASYALTDASFDDSLGSSNSAYFGDGTTATTSPSWDSSNAFVQLAQQGQFLTFPLPTLQSSVLTTAYTLSVVAWIKITSIPLTQATIFSTHTADGTESGYKLMVQSSLKLGMTVGTKTVTTTSSLPSVSLGSWQLIGFSMGPGAGNKASFGTVFVDSTSCQTYVYSVANFGLASATLLRIGGATQSFIGDISTVRIITPAGGYVRSSGTCSPLNSIELGTGSFPLTCSGSNSLNMLDGKCYTSCPATTISYTDGPVPVCACPAHCAICDSKQCLTCKTNYLFYQKACVNPCPAKTYSTATTCEDCPAHCATCDSTQCLTCDDNSYFVYNKVCVNSCPAKMYSTGTTCIDCPAHCATCDGTQCLTCDNSNYFVYNKVCVNSCPAKMYSTGATCKDCSDHCTQCDDSGCKVCENIYKLSNGKCVLPSSGGGGSGTSSDVASSSGGLSIRVIAAISGGSAVGLTGLIWLLCLWKKRRVFHKDKKVINISKIDVTRDQSPEFQSSVATEMGQMLP